MAHAPSRLVASWLFAIALAVLVTLAMAANPEMPTYDIYAIRYGTLKDIPVSALVPGADEKRKIDTALMVWLARGGGHTVLVDTGFHRERFIKEWHPVDYVSPDKAIARLGIKPDDVTDIVITHSHWDHLDGLDLFPSAHIWIQKAEYEHYTKDPGKHAEEGIYAEDLAPLIEAQAKGRVTLLQGDGQKILPGISAYIGGKHTFESEFVAVNSGGGPVVLASDNVYLYENIERHQPITETLDAASNLAAQDRMRKMVSDTRYIIPGHDALVFTQFPAPGNGVAQIK